MKQLFTSLKSQNLELILLVKNIKDLFVSVHDK